MRSGQLIHPAIDWANHFPDFAPEEIFSPETLPYLHLVNLDAMEKLQRWRGQVRKPFLINHAGHNLRGVRSCSEQAKLKRVFGAKAATHSMHVQGGAFDVTIKGLSVEEMVESAAEFGWHFIKKYPTFVHVDIRTLLAGVQQIDD